MTSVENFINLDLEERQNQILEIKKNNPESVAVLLTVDPKSSIPKKLTKR